jgi:serine/threonine-protein kinase
MDPNPEFRYETADAFRDALAAFVQHAGSRRLADNAARRAQELAELIAAATRDGETFSPQSTVDRVINERIQNLFGECRFGYRQALETWPGNERARTGIDRATRAMLDYELAQHNPRSAATLLATLDAPEPELRARVEKAVAEQAQAEARMADLERFQKQLDMSTGGRNRAIGAGALGLIWSVAPLLAPSAATAIPRLGRAPIVLFPVGVLLALAIWRYLSAEEIKASSVTRRLMRGAAVAMIGHLVLEAVAALLHLDAVTTEVLWPLVWFCVAAMLVITVDRRLFAMTLGFLGALFAAAAWPEWRFYAMFASNVVMTINMFSIWMPWR